MLLVALAGRVASFLQATSGQGIPAELLAIVQLQKCDKDLGAQARIHLRWIVQNPTAFHNMRIASSVVLVAGIHSPAAG